MPPRAWLVLLACACLAPFAGKAFHIDDTLFLRAAEQIRKHPGDFYGFTINWFGYPTQMIDAFDNPPLTSYCIALVTMIAGESETALHLAFLLPAAAAVLGTYALAKHFCGRPFLAALLCLLTPVFLISGTTVMCDMMLLALWVWAAALFEQALRGGRGLIFLAAGSMAGLAFLTKYSGLSLVPLMVAWGFWKTRRPGRWLIAPTVPLLFAVGYEWRTRLIYGHGLMFHAAAYASETRASAQVGPWQNAVVGLGFMGGCFLPVLFYAPWLWPRRGLVAGLFLFGVCLLVLPGTGALAQVLWPAEGGLNWAIFWQCAVFTVAGIGILALAAADFWGEAGQPTVLALWVLGVAVFAAGLNWTITARAFLPMAPAVAILMARRLERPRGAMNAAPCPAPALPALAAAILSLSLAKADFDFANSGRDAARQVCKLYQKPGQTLWFGGHWGFQYYMENQGAKPVDLKHPAMEHGDVVVYPGYRGSAGSPDTNASGLIATLTFFPNPHLATMDRPLGAGFYAASIGPLPFAAGKVEPSRYEVYQAK